MLPFPTELLAEANITVDWIKLYMEKESEEEAEYDDGGEMDNPNFGFCFGYFKCYA